MDATQIVAVAAIVVSTFTSIIMYLVRQGSVDREHRLTTLETRTQTHLEDFVRHCGPEITRRLERMETKLDNLIIESRKNP